MKTLAILGILSSVLFTSCKPIGEQTGRQLINIGGNKHLYTTFKDYPGPFTNSLSALVERDESREYFEQKGTPEGVIKWGYTYVDERFGAMSAYLYVGYYGGGPGVKFPEIRGAAGNYISAYTALNSKNITLTAKNGTLTLHFPLGHHDYDKIEVENIKGYYSFVNVIIGLDKGDGKNITIAVDQRGKDDYRGEILSHILQTNNSGVIISHITGVRDSSGQLRNKHVVLSPDQPIPARQATSLANKNTTTTSSPNKNTTNTQATSSSSKTTTNTQVRSSPPQAKTLSDTKLLTNIKVNPRCHKDSYGCLYGVDRKKYWLKCEINGSGCRNGFSVVAKTVDTNRLPQVSRSSVCGSGNKTVADLQENKIKLECKTDRDVLVELTPKKAELVLTKKILQDKHICVSTNASKSATADFKAANFTLVAGNCTAPVGNQIVFNMLLEFGW